MELCVRLSTLPVPGCYLGLYVYVLICRPADWRRPVLFIRTLSAARLFKVLIHVVTEPPRGRRGLLVPCTDGVDGLRVGVGNIAGVATGRDARRRWPVF